MGGVYGFYDRQTGAANFILMRQATLREWLKVGKVLLGCADDYYLFSYAC
jgi:hypothetical protein